VAAHSQAAAVPHSLAGVAHSRTEDSQVEVPHKLVEDSQVEVPRNAMVEADNCGHSVVVADTGMHMDLAVLRVAAHASHEEAPLGRNSQLEAVRTR